MGPLAGFSYREVTRRLRSFGFQFDRQGPGSHEIWRHSRTGRKVINKILALQMSRSCTEIHLVRAYHHASSDASP